LYTETPGESAVPRIAELVARLDAFAPRSLAADWDNVGLLVGDPASETERVLTCLTLTPSVAAEAVEQKAGLVVTHHPVLFRGSKSLTTANSDGRVLLPLLSNNIAVYSPHTAFDNCDGGINDQLLPMLDLTHGRPLRRKSGTLNYKLTVLTPDSDLDAVSAAAFDAGAGRIGNYSECSFRSPGTGTFLGNEHSNPTVGQRGMREQAPEQRVEFLVPNDKLDAVLTAVRKAHSYEEPAIDVYPLHSLSRSGEGRVGELATPIPLADFARQVKERLNAGTMQYVGDPTRPIRRVALACGAAGEFLPDAIRAGADLFLTGEVRFHDLLAAEAAGIALALPGHYATERPAVEALAGLIAGWFPGLTAWPSAAEREPLQAV
jgi:dinuclear metal center YbgI/SA1388 family protein